MVFPNSRHRDLICLTCLPASTPLPPHTSTSLTASPHLPHTWLPASPLLFASFSLLHTPTLPASLHSPPFYTLLPCIACHLIFQTRTRTFACPYATLSFFFIFKTFMPFLSFFSSFHNNFFFFCFAFCWLLTALHAHQLSVSQDRSMEHVACHSLSHKSVGVQDLHKDLPPQDGIRSRYVMKAPHHTHSYMRWQLHRSAAGLPRKSDGWGRWWWVTFPSSSPQ